MTSMESLIPVGGELTIGGLLGFVTGYAAKKIAKILAVLTGLQLALFKYLESRGVLDVNWSELSRAAPQTGEISQQANNVLMSMASTVGGGFAIGAVAGFKKA